MSAKREQDYARLLSSRKATHLNDAEAGEGARGPSRELKLTGYFWLSLAARCFNLAFQGHYELVYSRLVDGFDQAERFIENPSLMLGPIW